MKKLLLLITLTAHISINCAVACSITTECAKRLARKAELLALIQSKMMENGFYKFISTAEQINFINTKLSELAHIDLATNAQAAQDVEIYTQEALAIINKKIQYRTSWQDSLECSQYINKIFHFISSQKHIDTLSTFLRALVLAEPIYYQTVRTVYAREGNGPTITINEKIFIPTESVNIPGQSDTQLTCYPMVYTLANNPNLSLEAQKNFIVSLIELAGFRPTSCKEVITKLFENNTELQKDKAIAAKVKEFLARHR